MKNKDKMKKIMKICILVGMVIALVILSQKNNYYKTFYQRDFTSIRNNGFASRLENVLDNVDICIALLDEDETEQANGENDFYYTVEGILKNMQEHISRLRETAIRMYDFAVAYESARERYFWGLDFTVSTIPHVTSLSHGDIVNGCKYFEDFLERCVEKRVYETEAELLKEYLHEAKMELLNLQNDVKGYDFAGCESVKEWHRVYCEFLEEVHMGMWSAEFLYDHAGYFA